MQKTKLVMALPLIGALSVAGPSCAPGVKSALADSPAQPPLSGRSAIIEIVDGAQGKPVKTERFALSVVDERGWAELDSRSTVETTKIKVRADRDRNYAVVMTLEVNRSDMTSAAAGLQLSDSTPFFAGKRSIMSKVDRPDGTSTEVALLMQ